MSKYAAAVIDFSDQSLVRSWHWWMSIMMFQLNVTFSSTLINYEPLFCCQVQCQLIQYNSLAHLRQNEQQGNWPDVFRFLTFTFL